LLFIAEKGIPLNITGIPNELLMLKHIIRKGDVCIDVGANVGKYSYVLSKIVGNDGLVIAVEPYAPSIQRLSMLKRIANLSNVIIEPFAVSNSLGKTSLAIPKKNNIIMTGRIHVSPEVDDKSVTADVTTIDNIVNKYNLDRVAFIKYDVEGYELFAIKGAENTIKDFKPTILCEIEQRWTTRYGYAAEELFSYINGLIPYDSYAIHDKKFMSLCHFDNKYCDYLFIPIRPKQ